MKNFRGKVAVVTGAGSGIGRALAQNLAAKGCKLALCDINKKSVDETKHQIGAGTEIMTRKVDVSSRAEMKKFTGDVMREFGAVDIVINNAGVGLLGSIEDNTYEELEWLLGINLWGVIYGTKEFLPYLKQRPEASLVNISSIGGIVSTPYLGAYVISKFAVRSLSEVLQMELVNSTVTVTSVHPGGIKTNIGNASRASEAIAKDRGKLVPLFNRLLTTPPATAAEVIVDAIERKKKRVLVGMDAKVLGRMQRLFPVKYMGALARLNSLVFPG